MFSCHVPAKSQQGLADHAPPLPCWVNRCLHDFSPPLCSRLAFISLYFGREPHQPSAEISLLWVPNCGMNDKSLAYSIQCNSLFVVVADVYRGAITRDCCLLFRGLCHRPPSPLSSP